MRMNSLVPTLFAVGILSFAVLVPASAAPMMSVSVGGMTLNPLNPGTWPMGVTGTFSGPSVVDGVTTMSGDMSMADNWNFDWMLVFKPDPFVNLIVDITNAAGSTQLFGVAASSPVVPALPAPTQTHGSLSGSVTDTSNNGAADLRAPSVGAGDPFDGALYDARIDGSSEQILAPAGNGLTYSGAAGGSASYVIPLTFGPQAGPAVNTEIGIINLFTLTAGDTVHLDSYFEVVAVPEPASIGLVGASLIGLVVWRRRRSGL